MAKLLFNLLMLVVNMILALVLLVSLSAPFHKTRAEDHLVEEVAIPNPSQLPASSPREVTDPIPCPSGDLIVECSKVEWMVSALDITSDHYMLRLNCTKTPLLCLSRSFEEQINDP